MEAEDAATSAASSGADRLSAASGSPGKAAAQGVAATTAVEHQTHAVSDADPHIPAPEDEPAHSGGAAYPDEEPLYPPLDAPEVSGAVLAEFLQTPAETLRQLLGHIRYRVSIISLFCDVV